MFTIIKAFVELSVNRSFKDTLRPIKADTVLCDIGPVLGLIPLKFQTNALPI